MKSFEELLAILNIKTAEKEKCALSWLLPFLADTILDILDHQSAQACHMDDLPWLLDDLHWLMTEPAWMEAHVAKDGHYANFLNEVQMAWRVADKAGEIIEQTRVKMIGRQVRYALLQTSINSLASNMPLEMLLAGIHMGKWKVEAALAYAKQVTHGMTKVTMLTHIGAFLRKQHGDERAREALTDALVGLRDIDSSADFVEALIALVPHLSPDLLTDAFSLAQEIPSEADCMRVVCKLLPRLPLELQDEVLWLVEESGSSEEKALAIAELAQNLPAGVLHPALEIIRQSWLWPKAQAKALVALSSRLPAQLIPDALAVAEAIENPLYKTAALMAFPQYGNPEERLDMVKQSLITAWDSLDIDDRAEGTALLAPHLPSALSHEVFKLAINLGAEEVFGGGLYRIKALKALGPHLPLELQTQLMEILRKAPSFLSFLFRIDILAALIPHLPQELLPIALTTARELIQEAYADEDSPHFTASTIPKPLVKLFPHLQLVPDLIPEALAAVSEIKAADARCFALAELVPYLPKSLLPKALESAKHITDPQEAFYHILPLIVLSQHGSPSAFNNAMEIVAQAQYGDESVIVLPVLLATAASICSSTQRSVFVDEAFASARNIANPQYRSQALVEIAKLIPELRKIILDEAYKAVDDIQSPDQQSTALARLIPSLTIEERRPVANQLMTLAQTFAHRYDGDDTALEDSLLSLLTPFLSGQQPETPSNTPQSNLSDDQIQSLINTTQHWSVRDRFEAWNQLALHLPPNLPNNQRRAIAVKVLESAENVDASDHYNLGISLARLIPLFPPDLCPSALALARKIQSPHALAAFVPYASDKERQRVLGEALTVAGIRSTGEKVDIPTTLVPYLLPYLPPHQQLEALQTALAELQQIPFPANWEYFRQTLRPIAKAWAHLPSYQQAYALWKPTLHEYATYRREHFLAALSGLLPVVHAFGSTAAVIETMNAVLEVCRRWSWSSGSPQPSR